MDDDMQVPAFLRLLLVSLVGVTGGASVRAELPVNAPPQRDDGPPPVVEVILEDPIRPDARSYLDLDSGETFAYADSTPEYFLASRRWIKTNGVDLMCETRPPADGFVVYHLALQPTDEPFDRPRELAAVRNLLGSVESHPFDLISLNDNLPKTYLFRTQEGRHGVLEISALVENPRGLKLRYQQLRPPPLPTRRSRQGVMLGLGVQAKRARVERLKQMLGPHNPQIVVAQRELQLAETLAEIHATENNPQRLALRTELARKQWELDRMRERVGEKNLQITKQQQAIDRLKEHLKQTNPAN